MNQANLKSEIETLQRFLKDNVHHQLITDCFDKQIEFIDDTTRFKAALCTRRAGKSMAAGYYLISTGLKYDEVNCLYIALTRESAKRILYKDILKYIDKKYHLKLKFNETTLTVTFPNGSILYLLGLDSGPDEAEKALGQKYKLIVIDEAASFRQSLSAIVDDILKPTLVDLRGTLALIGTPRNNIYSLFYDITNQKISGWSVHKWSAYDNPFVSEEFAEDIERMKRDNPNIEQTASFKQMYLGEWTIDDSALVYKYSISNLVDDIPNRRDYIYLLGVDLGYNDDTSFVVACYSPHDPTLYILLVHKQTQMDISSVAERIKYYRQYYNFIKIVVDGSNKQAVEEMKNRYQLPLHPTDKAGKQDFIELMNSDFITGKIKLVRSQTKFLQDEYKTLVWDIKANGQREEDSKCPNHAADAALYVWRYCYSYASKPKPQEPHYSTEAYVDKIYAKESEEIERRKNEPWYES